MKNNHDSNFLKRSDLFYQTNGPLTQELALGDSILGKLPKRLMPDATVKMVCGFCSTGCNLTVHLQNGHPVNLTPTQQYPVNFGEACPKGWEALSPLFADDRALRPYQQDRLSGQKKAISWEEALKVFVLRFKGIQQKYGQSSIAFLSTGQICTEEMALLGVLTKFGMGIIHGDSNTRQCMATAATAYKESFGFDAPPYTYQDFEESDVLIFVGANPAIAHPIMWQRVNMNKHHPKIIVIDPRYTETAMGATHHYAIKPKSDLGLLYGLAHILIKRGWIDQSYIEKHTEGFLGFKKHVEAFFPFEVSQSTGVSVNEIENLAQMIHQGKRVSFWWTMGVNQSYEGVRTAQAIINLSLMTGNIGRPGTGANSITGQCNAMGSRLFSNTTNLLGGHDFLNPAHRQKVAAILNIDEGLISNQPSWAYDEIVEGIVTGKIRGLWIIGTNPVHSWIHQKEFREILKRLEFLVVQDMYFSTETAQCADLILPAAGWGEKEGTVINSERRFGLFKNVSRAPGEALADFYIFKLVAQYWGCADLFDDWSSPQAVFQILKKISSGMPYDFSGIDDYAMIEKYGGIQWPFKKEALLTNHQRRLFEDGKFFYPNQKARFIFESPRKSPEEPTKEFPYILLTGRGSSSQWHTQTRTGKSAVLRKMYPSDIYVEMNPQDAKENNIQHDQKVIVESLRATIVARVLVTETVKLKEIFIPMHYGLTNQLTFPAFDPYSRQPSYKMCAVRIKQLPLHRVNV